MTRAAVTVVPAASVPGGSVGAAPRDRGFWQWNVDFGLDPGVDLATWTSPEVGLDAATDVIASWTATTPPGCWLQVHLRGVTEAGEHTKDFVMGRWSAHDMPPRTSISGQGDRHGDVLVDRFVAADGHALTRMQLSVTLYRSGGARRLRGCARSPPSPPGPRVPSGQPPRGALPRPALRRRPGESS